MKKWDDDTIKYIFELKELGWSTRVIAEKYGVTSARMRRIIKDYNDRQMQNSETSLGLSTRVINCLKRANVQINPSDIALNMAILVNIDGLGKRSLQEIVQFLQSSNILQ